MAWEIGSTSLLVRNDPGAAPAVLTLASGNIRGGPGIITDHPDNDQPAQIINTGATLKANVAATALTVDLAGGWLQQGGSVQALSGATVHFARDFTQTGGLLIFDGGDITSPTPLNVVGGSVVFGSDQYDFDPSRFVDVSLLDVRVQGSATLNFVGDVTVSRCVKCQRQTTGDDW